MRIESQLIYGILILFCMQLAFASEQELAACAAPSKYLTLLKLDSQKRESGLDYSCFSSYQSLSRQVKSYQLVDVRSEPAEPVVNAWLIPAAELKYMHYLAERRLLLISEGFSRLNGAKLCAELKTAGIRKAKILLNGIDIWQSMHAKKQPPRYVKPSDVISEITGGGDVVMVATLQEKVNLTKLGFENVISWDGVNLPDGVFTKAQNGFNPVVILADLPLAERLKARIAGLPGLYILQGGVSILAAEINKNIVLNRARLKSLQGGFCAKS